MKFKNKRAFFFNFILMLFSVFVPCIFFCTLISYLWMQQAQEDAFANDGMMLSLASRTFDTVLRDTTLAIGLMETDDQLTASLSSSSQELMNMSAAQFLGLESAWNDTARIIMAKPYVSEVYFFLERYPDFVFTEDGISALSSIPDTRWLDIYHNQESSVHLWAQPLSANPELPQRSEHSIYIYRRLPYLHWPDELKGVIAVRLEEAYFDALFDDLPQNTLRNIFILDDKFTQLYSLHGGTYTQYLKDEDIVFGERVNFTRTTSQGKILISVVNSSTFNWSYISILPLSSISGQFKNMRRFVYLFIILAFFISICLASFITRRNYRPIRTMVQMIDTYRIKGIIEDVEKYSHDEYGYVIYNLVQTLVAKQSAEKNLAIEKLLQKEASLLAMQAQINPHFLYNTLEVINWEAIDLLGAGNNISQMLLCLSSNLRYITQKNGRLVALREELDNLAKYITLQKLFTDDKISFSFRIDNQLLESKVPKLILQPLVENALTHGLPNASYGIVRICVQERCDGVRIKVLDNGKGFSPEKLKTIQNDLEQENTALRTRHLGLQNIDSRLKLLYGKEYGLSIRTKQSRGTCITVFLPNDESENHSSS